MSASDSLLTVGDEVQISVSHASEPSIPVLIAPELNRSTATVLADATAFLYSGPQAVQTGVPSGTIDPKRAAVLRGRIRSRTGDPLPGVYITVPGHAEYGHAFSRTNGEFDLAVNGGGILAVQCEKDGFLTVQRQANVPWQEYVNLPEVVMIPFDPRSTPTSRIRPPV